MFLGMENNARRMKSHSRNGGSLMFASILVLISSTDITATVKADAVKPRWSFIKCQIDCMPMCMSIKNVKTSSCRIACRSGCDQLKGRGVVQASGWDVPNFVPIPRP
ncbi:hypothetical protein V6N13_064655 [Hibiscus sabdariffa]|uniref:Plant thionin family protein n=1 Tax=Hibiscus sabdariffa TaxID=183260 RepID=A0ABR2EAQ0_9ROSI